MNNHPDDQHALIPSSFLRAWYSWLHKPTSPDCPRPGILDCAAFICTHGMLNVDPNMRGDRRDEIVFIKLEDFDELLDL